MNPMVRINSAQRGQALQPVRRVTPVKVLAWLSFAFGVLGVLSGLLTAAMLAFVTTTTLLMVESLSARSRSTQERLEGMAKELTLMRQMLAQLSSRDTLSSGSTVNSGNTVNSSTRLKGEDTDEGTPNLGAGFGARAQPQSAGD